MKRWWQSLSSLTVASVKMYFRNITAVFFTLFIPIFLVLIIGALNSGKGGTISIALTNHSTNKLAVDFVDSVKKIDAFKIDETDEASAGDKLGKGKVDLQVVIPENFGANDKGKFVPSKIETYYNEARPQSGQTAALILGQVISQINSGVTNSPQVLTLAQTGVKTNNQGPIDYLIPGIMAMSIMQLGIFSVAFAFISYKTSGALRRLQATPTHPLNFIIAQSIARLLIGGLQMGVLLTLGVLVFKIHVVGSLANLMIVAVYGTLIFLAFGFAVAGWARDENQAAPVANLITFPMLFLSGVFFPRDGFPTWLKAISDFFPLTYLADAMHRIANEGATLWAIRGDLLGLAAWGVLGYFLAVTLFNWE